MSLFVFQLLRKIASFKSSPFNFSPKLLNRKKEMRSENTKIDAGLVYSCFLTTTQCDMHFPLNSFLEAISFHKYFRKRTRSHTNSHVRIFFNVNTQKFMEKKRVTASCHRYMQHQKFFRVTLLNFSSYSS